MKPEQIIELSIKAAANYWDEQRKRERKDRHDKRLRNTRLLLRNYKTLRDHCHEARFSADPDHSESAIDILDELENQDRDVYIESIRRSVIRTRIIIGHIDAMLRLYRIYCSEGRDDDKRRYRIIELTYLQDGRPDIKAICTAEGIDERTYYRDTREACEKLSALIFGIDGLGDMSKTCQ